MDKKTEALKLALEALRFLTTADEMEEPPINATITAIREALMSVPDGAEQPKESPKFDPNESFAREEAAQARVREFMRNH